MKKHLFLLSSIIGGLSASSALALDQQFIDDVREALINNPEIVREVLEQIEEGGNTVIIDQNTTIVDVDPPQPVPLTDDTVAVYTQTITSADLPHYGNPDAEQKVVFMFSFSDQNLSDVYDAVIEYVDKKPAMAVLVNVEPNEDQQDKYKITRAVFDLYGNDAYIKLVNVVGRSKEPLSKEDILSMAVELGLNKTEIVSEAFSSEAQNHLDSSLALQKLFGVSTTPTVITEDAIFVAETPKYVEWLVDIN